MIKRRIKKILSGTLLVLVITVLVLGMHIYIVTRPKAPTANTIAMARIDFKQDITSEDASRIVNWLYQQKGIDHVLCNEKTKMVVFTFHPLTANANNITLGLKTCLHLKGDRYIPSEKDMQRGCPVASTSISYKAYNFIKHIF